MRLLTDPARGHDLFLVRIAGVEVVSALVRHIPALPQPSLQIALTDFGLDIQNHYRVIPVNRSLVTSAIQLAIKHRLRGYDAVQLAAALKVRNQIGAPSFISADADLNLAALAEGYTVDDPTTHP